MTYVGVLSLDHYLTAARDIDTPDLFKTFARSIAFPLCHWVHMSEKEIGYC